MSDYPAWWDTTVTIYNKYTDATTKKIVWVRHVVENCFWSMIDDKVKIGATILEVESTICRIRESELFVPDYEWAKLSDEDKETYFTLGVEDIIVKAEVDDTIDEYTAGQRSTDLVTKYHKAQGCLVIEKAHIAVGPNMPIPHYRVKGV